MRIKRYAKGEKYIIVRWNSEKGENLEVISAFKLLEADFCRGVKATYNGRRPG